MVILLTLLGAIGALEEQVVGGGGDETEDDESNGDAVWKRREVSAWCGRGGGGRVRTTEVVVRTVDGAVAERREAEGSASPSSPG